MINCVIIDDDAFAIDSLKKVIDEIKDLYFIKIVATFTNSIEASKEIENINFDLLFIDYEMPGYNGVEFVKKIEKDVSVIFVTSHTELSQDIINEVNIIGFLSKPTLKEKLEIILKKDSFNRKELPSKIVIPNGKKEIFFLNPNDIYYIESDGKYKHFFGIDELLEIPKEKEVKQKKESIELVLRRPIEKGIEISFDKLEKLLSPYGFEKISRKHLVNIDKIYKKSTFEIVLVNNKSLIVGESIRKKFFTKLKELF